MDKTTSVTTAKSKSVREKPVLCIKITPSEYPEYTLEKPLFSWYYGCIITNGGVLYVRTKYDIGNRIAP